MSLKSYWQRICQSIQKMKDMNHEDQEVFDENIPENDQNIQEEKPEKEVENEENAMANELAEQKDKNLRLFAEFENYRKRTNKERLELYKTANESLLQDLLPVLDDFERANAALESSEDKELTKGVDLIRNKLIKILENKGLTRIDTTQGDDFDLEKHEAITQIDAPSEDLKGKIVDVVETGYTLKDKVIRYAKVVVGK